MYGMGEEQRGVELSNVGHVQEGNLVLMRDEVDLCGCKPECVL